jgi:hypothetical protein
MGSAYVHGYHARENRRLRDQAGPWWASSHHDTAYPPAAGCSRPGAASAPRP